MTDEAKAKFLELSAQHLDLLRGLYQDVQWRYWGRLVTTGFVIPQSLLDSLSGVPQAAKSALYTAGVALQTLTDMAPRVPQGGSPHGAAENWVTVWIDLAESTEQNLYTAMQGMGRTSAFAAMMETWRRYAALIGKFLGGAGEAAKAISGAAIVVGGLLILREFFGRKK